MFYSHEILTSRKYGVATVWLVATLGAIKGDSALKKIGRKEILSVNVSKACTTVLHPDAPFALRLQSTLLVGISKVYRQQFDYLYHDVSQAYSNIRKLNSSAGTSVLNINVDVEQSRVINPNQLLLQNDPAFTLDLLPEYDLDGLFPRIISNLFMDGSDTGTPISRVRGVFQEVSDFQTASIQSNSSGIGLDDFEHSLYGKHEPPTDRRKLERIEEDPGFEFTEDGELRELSPLLLEPSQLDSLPCAGIALMHSKSDAHQREGILNTDILEQVWLGHDASQKNTMNYQDEGYANATLEGIKIPEPVQSTLRHGNQRNRKENRSSENNIARKKCTMRGLQYIEVDDGGKRLSLSTDILRQWRRDYVQNMDIVRKQNVALKVSRRAKTLANMLVLEYGICGKLNNTVLRSMFSGNSLRDFLWGKKPKRWDGENACTNIQNSTKKIKINHNGIGHGNLNETIDDLEFGRDGSNNLNDTFQWNGPISRAHSALDDLSLGALPSSSIAGDFPGSTIQTKPRISRSPLTARKLTGDRSSRKGSILGQVKELNEDTKVLTGFNLPVIDEFEFFGAGAGMTTQDANTQCLQGALDDQSYKMFEFLKSKIVERRLDCEEESGDVDFVTFEQFIKPDENRRIVAAQGFHHLLLLASKGLVYVSQEQSYGSIQICTVDS